MRLPTKALAEKQMAFVVSETIEEQYIVREWFLISPGTRDEKEWEAAMDICSRENYLKKEAPGEEMEKGIAKEMAKARRELVMNLLRDTDFDLKKIALLTGTAESFLRELKKES